MAQPFESRGLRLHPLLKRAVALAFALLLAGVGPVLAQPREQPGRPKLGLVLSGGGAMGIAHVGAIQELERLGIRPDLVVGTSMGSIVGGLYASGMSGAELQVAVETMNWDAIFDTTPPRDGLSYRRKQQQADFPVKASIGVVDGKLRQPDALISDANLLLQLRRLLGARAAVPDFDHLPIPFRAVATDIETGKKHVIDRGELAGAMRASMSVPGVFAPYRLDGKLLVDGGMADNVPIDVAREMGADIVIVFATQTPLAKGDDVSSLAQVLGQTVTLLILANERQQLSTLKPTDVLVPIDVAPLTAADFKRGPALIAAGHRAAAAKETELRRVAALRGPSHVVAVAKPPPVIDYVRVENDSRLSDKIILREVEPFTGQPMDPDEIVTALQEIYALGVFTRVDFTIEEKEDKTGLVIHAVQRPGDANRLRPGITVFATGKGRSEFDFSLDYRILQLDAYGSEARFIGVVGDRKRLAGEYFKVLDSRQRWFVNVGADLQRRPVAVYDSDGFRQGEYNVQYALASLAAGRQFGTWGELRAGYEIGIGEADLQEGVILPEHADLDIGRFFVSGGVDTLDNPYFPTRGVRLQAQWTYGREGLGDVADYQKAAGSALFAAGWGANAVLLNIEGGDTLEGDLPLSSLYSLGGPFSFPGLGVDELTGETYAAVRTMYRRRLGQKADALFQIPLYAGMMFVAGNTWARHGDFDTDDIRIGGSVFVAADTGIGPVFLSLGAADEGRTGVYLFIGKPF